jgi:hypothetical protein
MERDERTTQEVIDDHLALRKAGDLETDIARNYDPEVVLISLTGVRRGHDGVRDQAAELLAVMRGGEYRYRKVLVADEYAYLEWDAYSDNGRICNGADSYVVRGGKLVMQTAHYYVEGD